MTFAFDASPLNHFARAGHLHTLELVTKVGGRRVVTTAVLGELKRGAQVDPALLDIQSSDWLEEVHVNELGELGVFAEYARFLGSGDRHVGEASTLAWAEVHGATAIIDDRPGTLHGRRRGVSVHGSLWLISNAYKASLLTERAVTRLVDALVDTEAWFPCNGDTFFSWGRENGLL